MSKILIIAEKPSVAGDLARVLGKELGKFARHKEDGYFENSYAVIASAVGHLLELRKPTTPEGKPLPWNFASLPVIPDDFVLEPNKQSADKLRTLLVLANRKDVTEIVNACDAGREGELIFANLARYGKWQKTIKRLWMQSMTDDSILSAWSELRTAEQMRPLGDAALCRSESDWLVGLNSTRGLTALQSRGGFNVTPAGRVQTPTLAILVRREKEIAAFVAEPYCEVHGTFGVATGDYVGKWIDTAWKKSDNVHLRPERIWSTKQAQAIAARCSGKEGVVAEEKKTVSVIAPLLYDLTSLQRDASNRFGFSARRTLQLAQECYEKHKVLTYPRTDSRYLPEDYIGKVIGVLSNVADSGTPLAAFASEAVAEKRVKRNKRVFDNKMVSDHFAIIPTGRIEELPTEAKKIYDMVLARFIAVFFPPAVFEDTRRTTTIHEGKIDDVFLTTGRVMVEPGWQAVYGKRPGVSSKGELVAAKKGELAQVKDIQVVETETNPPARYNEATLLASMEGAGKLVEDDELRAAMSERGLGTPATRAAIIEGLISQEYIAREGKELVASRRGVELIDLLDDVKLSLLTSPDLTGEWEYKLKQMEHGKLARTKFMKEIKAVTIQVVEAIKSYKSTTQENELPELALTCPVCKAVGLKNTHDAVACRKCKFNLRRVIAGRGLADEEIAGLVENGKTPIMEGFLSRFGKPFIAGLILDEKGKSKFYFQEVERDADEAELEEAKIVGKHKLYDGKTYEVVETSKSWRIPKLVIGKEKQGMSMAKTILGHELKLEDFLSVFIEGKSELIKGFVSQRTKKPFDAFLVLNKRTGKVGFEFPPREKKTDKGKERKPYLKKNG